jgi:hypothetical protein
MELVMLGTGAANMYKKGQKPKLKSAKEERGTARWNRRANGRVVEVLQESMRLRRGVKVVDHRFEDSVRIQINW